MTLLPKVKLKTLVSFPAAVFGGTGIAVRKQDGQFFFDLAFDEFAPPVGSIPDAVNQNALLWNKLSNSYLLAPVSLFGGGGGVPEAPNDGVQYGRQSLGWTPVSAGGTPSSTLPVMDGVAAPGVLATYSRGDHVHPTDTSRAPLASPVFTGNPTAPTPAPGDSDTSIATTAFVAAAIAGGGTFVDAPSDGSSYGRLNAAWTKVLPLVGGTLTGALILNANPATALGAATKQYVDNGFQPLDTDLTALAALATSGLIARTGAGTVASRTVTAPAAGLTVSNGDGVAGNPTLVLANDLAALEGLGGTGLARRTGVDTWSTGTAVANAELATMAAFTFKGNNTGSAAVPTDVDIGALTAKATPAPTDEVMIRDNAASGAWKRSPVSSLSSASGVSSYNTRTGAVVASGTDVPLRNYIAGLTLIVPGGNNQFAINAGVATDSTNAAMMLLGVAIAKQTGAWVVGSGNGGLDTGVIAASTWYHVFTIRRPDTGVVDACISTTIAGPTFGVNIPAAYTQFRRVGSVKTDASSLWISMVQNGDEFLWPTPTKDIDITTLDTTAILIPLNVAPGVKVNALMRGMINHAAALNEVLISSPDEISVAVDTPNGNRTAEVQVANQACVLGTLAVRTDTSRQVRAVATASNTTLRIVTYGWIDPRGKDA